MKMHGSRRPLLRGVALLAVAVVAPMSTNAAEKEALEEPVTVPANATEKEPLGWPVTVEFDQTPLKDVLDLFAKDFGLNFAWASRPSEEMPVVTAKMKEVPARTALEAISAAAGLTCQFVGGNVAVLTVKAGPGKSGRGAARPAEPREGPLFVHGFERSLDGWFAPRFNFDGITIDGKVMKTDREGDVKMGKSSLEWRYEFAPDHLSAITRSIRLDPAVIEFRFWVKTERAPVTLVMGLKEQDESEYQAVVQLDTEGQWILRKVTLSEFVLDDDGEDENHGIDLDQVREISFADLTGLFQQTAGVNAIWLDDFTAE